MPKVTFVYPDFESLGVEYLMAVSLKEGYDIDFIYYQAEDAYLGKKIKNIPFDDIAAKIAQTEPDIAAFSCVTDNYQYQLSCANALKEIMPGVKTVFGGVHPTAVPEKVLANRAVDCVAIGEAEESFSSLLKKGRKNRGFSFPETAVEGMVFKKNGDLIGELKEGALPDLNKIPCPHKALCFLFLKNSVSEYRIMASRGCPYRCSYCSNSYLNKIKSGSFVRRRTVDNVIAELVWARKQYPLEHILFTDDCFATDTQWTTEFCARYKKEVGLPFTCLANPDYIDEEKIRELRDAGCIYMQIGIQTLSEELCGKVIHRNNNRAKIIRVIEGLRKSKIMIQVDHMLGIPDDSLSNQEESILFYNKYRPDLVSIFWLAYYPKTAIVEIARGKNILTDEEINNIDDGRRITSASFLMGGDIKNPSPYYGAALLLSYLPILPKWLVKFLVRTRLYRIIRTDNYFICVALPRIIISIFNRNYYRGRKHIKRFIEKKFRRKTEK